VRARRPKVLDYAGGSPPPRAGGTRPIWVVVLVIGVSAVLIVLALAIGWVLYEVRDGLG